MGRLCTEMKYLKAILVLAVLVPVCVYGGMVEACVAIKGVAKELKRDL